MSETNWKRSDGRQPDQLRPVQISPGYLKTAAGSALIEMGDTKVLCTVSPVDGVPPFLVGTGKGWLTAEYSMLPGSSTRRVAREPNSRSREIQRLIGRSLRAVVDLEQIGERTLYVDCDVIQADGGTRTAAISGAWLALALAIRGLEKQARFKRSPLFGQIAAVSVGIYKGTPVLDLDYAEDSDAETDMNIVMNEGGRFVEVQGTAEGHAFTPEEFDAMIGLAGKGIDEIVVLQSQILAG